jgi:hypothetical protein
MTKPAVTMVVQNGGGADGAAVGGGGGAMAKTAKLADNQAESSSNGEDQATASTDTATDGVAANDDAAPKAKTGRGRGRRVAKADPAVVENASEDNTNADYQASVATAEPASNGSVNTAAADDNGDMAVAKKTGTKAQKAGNHSKSR